MVAGDMALDFTVADDAPYGYRTVEDFRAGRRTLLDIDPSDLARIRRVIAVQGPRPKINIEDVGKIIFRPDPAATAKAVQEMRAQIPRVAGLTPELLGQWMDMIAAEVRSGLQQ